MANNRIKPLLEKTAVDSRAWSGPPVMAPPAKILAFLNQHALNIAARNRTFYDFLMSSDYLLRDGVGTKIALKWFGLPTTKNLNGSDLISELLTFYKDKKLALLGSSAAVAETTYKILQAQGINIVCAENGFQDDDFYRELCRRLRPQVLLLCMGMPRQEILAGKLRDEDYVELIICGGGWADFYSGAVRRAPLWMRKSCLEWMYRLYKEPKRLGKRYTIDIIRFLGIIILQRIWQKRCG